MPLLWDGLLLQRFGTTSAGTPFSRIDWLKEWRLTVVRGEGNLEILAEYLDLGLPVIVAVQTWPFAHWQTQATEHTVVVVGIEQGNVIVHVHNPSNLPQPVDPTTVAHLHCEYPNGLQHQLQGETDVCSPAQLHPTFYGCYD